jgi:hypothetical protein
MKNYLVEQFKNEKRWVTYRAEKVSGKTTKIPYAVNGKKASSTDSATWSTYAEAKKASDQVGIVFTPDQLLLGIDIDHCLKGTNITHAEANAIVDFIIQADTYTEISPSGEGLHLFLKLTAPLALTSNKHAPFEAYTSGRYFTVTQKPYKEAREIRTVSPDEALGLLSIIGYPWGKKSQTEALQGAGEAKKPLWSDDQLLERMFAAQNGAKIKKLYDGDIRAYKNDESAADMALCSHLAFWTRKDAAQMERIWVASPLGSRKKTKARADYRNRTIREAIANCKEVYSSFETLAHDLDLMFSFTLSGKTYTQNLENICRVLRKHKDFSGRFRFDVFRNFYEIKEGEVWRDLRDTDALHIQAQISILFPCFAKIGKELVYDAIIRVSEEQKIDSAADYMRSLAWDQTPRLDTWLTQTYGTPDDVYHRAVGSNWLKGLVKRIVEPGSKFDYVLVLEGEQGVRKSTSLAILGGGWHVETAMSTDTKDFFMQFQGKAIVEFSEGETLSRTEVKRMKAIITMQSDTYRPPYGRASITFQRRCVFAMTTNQTEYLKDETGNRRWLPVTVVLDKANTEWLAENREQLFAEAYHRVITLKETTWEFPEAETRIAQEARQIKDPNTDLIIDWYANIVTEQDKWQGITVHQAYRDALHGGHPYKPIDRYVEMTLADIFKRDLKLQKKRVMVEGVRAMRWFGEQQFNDPDFENRVFKADNTTRVKKEFNNLKF